MGSSSTQIATRIDTQSPLETRLNANTLPSCLEEQQASADYLSFPRNILPETEHPPDRFEIQETQDPRLPKSLHNGHVSPATSGHIAEEPVNVDSDDDRSSISSASVFPRVASEPTNVNVSSTSSTPDPAWDGLQIPTDRESAGGSGSDSWSSWVNCIEVVLFFFFFCFAIEKFSVTG
jgi:hypothetical protein